jgi:hypothetical protein
MESQHNIALSLINKLEHTKKTNKCRISKFDSSDYHHCFDLHPDSSFNVKTKSILITGPDINQHRSENFSIINFINENKEYVCISISHQK